MYRITTMFPEDPRQPFYNPNSPDMTPMARLYLRKTKTFARNCDDNFLQSQVLEVSENAEDDASRRKSFDFCICAMNFHYLKKKIVSQLNALLPSTVNGLHVL